MSVGQRQEREKGGGREGGREGREGREGGRRGGRRVDLQLPQWAERHPEEMQAGNLLCTRKQSRPVTTCELAGACHQG